MQGRWATAAVGLSATILLGYLVWGLAIGPRRLRVEHHVARIPHLPPCWDGEEIALLSDLQVGMPFGNEAVAADAVRHIVRRRPAAVLLAGDFILHTPGDATDRIATALALLRPLVDAGVRALAVLGNHDYQLNDDAPREPALEDQIAEAFGGIGITVLRNEVAELQPRRPAARPAPLYIVGLGERRMGDDHVGASLADLPEDAARIILMHNPDTFPRLPAGTAPLAVAGHTHGAQVRFVPGAARPWWMRIAGMPRDLQRGSGWAGAEFGMDGNRLYISRGIGFSRAPIRINAPPELTFFRLGRGRA
jgi:uncharacterized protein